MIKESPFFELSKNSYLKNVVYLVTGASVAKIFVIIITPILSRIFTPDQFGALGIFTSILGFLALGSTLSYSRAIILPKSNYESKYIYSLSIVILTVYCLIVGIVLFHFSTPISQILNIPELLLPLKYLTPILYLYGLYDLLDHYFTRQKQFKTISRVRIIRSVLISCFQLLAGILGMLSYGLIVGFALGVSITSILFFYFLYKNYKYNHLHSLKNLIKNNAIFIKIIKKYKDFPLYSTPSNLLSKGSGTAIPILLTIFFSPYVTGLYWFTRRIIMLANDTIVRSIRQAISQKASELINSKRNIYNLLVKNTLFLIGIWTPVVIVIILFGPYLFEIVFGESWYDAGVYARYLVIMGITEFGRAPALEMVYVLKLQKDQLYFEIISTIVRIGSIYVGAIFSDPLLAIILLSVCTFIIYLINIIYVGIKCRRNNLESSES